MSSAEKKRLRDRRAQQALRDKKLRHTAKLEQQLAHCEQYHNDQKVQQRLQEIELLRRQNEALTVRHEKLRQLVRSWDVDPADSISWDSSAAAALQQAPQGIPNLHEVQENADLNGYHRQMLLASDAEPHYSTAAGSVGEPSDDINDSNADPFSPTAFLSASTLQPPLSKIPPPSLPSCIESSHAGSSLSWSVLPLNDDDFSVPRNISCPWFSHPAQIALAPDSPSSPLDILYGTRTNPLADEIHSTLRRRPLQDPEHLALGWILYHFTKWLVTPNPATFPRLPDFMKPLWEQSQIMHPMVLDFITWPRLRLKLIQQWLVYRERWDELLGMLASSVRVRWPREESILCRDPWSDEVKIRRGFYETFTRESGWGILPDFMESFPDVVAGVGGRALVYDV
ncbi:hypothetical protein AJ79_02165 [Helicocarpus griseus UAMH5409]|uniref:BZIP domain-containing protein n=1 Tax=Helicocarpus griseus UAMH5409 TaxID=1447875 RepID=A0A2B7Y3K2_9EURO|nr:hypothetical protein AJ79_02165 [Helicocarpus griseus UAMH5409]